MQESLRAKYAHDERDKFEKINSEKAKKIKELLHEIANHKVFENEAKDTINM